MKFSFATEADLAAVHALVESAYRGESSRAGWTTEADLVDGPRTSVDELRAIITAPDNAFLLARDGAGSLLACCHLQRRGDALYFGMFAVDPTRQADGVGTAMLAEAERIARDLWRLPRVTMQVIEARTELIDWYARRGYHQTGNALPFPYDVQARTGPRIAGLRLVMLEKAL
ncbi:MAG: GNAT family N-acetyltransferase [Actinomycetes bacterium]